MTKIAVYPGSFDPVTCGHLDVIHRAAGLFDKVVVAVLCNSAKNPMFSAQERMQMIQDVTKDLNNVTVDSFEGLLVNYMQQTGANVIVKGLRALSDFEYEFQMALLNRKLCNDVETMFMMTNEGLACISSSVVKEVASHDGQLQGLVPTQLVDRIYTRCKTQKR